ncbi:carboxymuconolactone decarboxylase family protein [Nonomuraea maheshkhaliensis]|uniref:carboxymuconolactone decarboxylase family protein n=1 Tax=Nonomuraea maheshkhaliensis TaxID=419590 RepID=UPI0031FA1C18
MALRVSRINGRAACVDMHTKDAAHAGETSVRLNLVAVWREATAFAEPGGPPWSWPSRARASRTRSGCPRRGLGERRQTLRRGPTRRPAVPHRPHEHLEPSERHHPAACHRRLPAGTVGIAD